MSSDQKKVGYRNPPKHSQFGTEAKPGGRPKGAKNRPKPLTDESFQDIIHSEAARLIPVREGDEISYITTARAITRTVFQQTIRNKDVKAAALSMNAIAAADEKKKKKDDQYRDELIQLRRRLYNALARGVSVDELPFHPDLMYLDPDSGKIRVASEEFGEQIAIHHKFWKLWNEKIETIKKELNTRQNPESRKRLLDELKDYQRKYDEVRPVIQQFPQWPQRW